MNIRIKTGLSALVFSALQACSAPLPDPGPPESILVAYELIQGGETATPYAVDSAGESALALEGLLAATQKSAKQETNIRFWTSYCLALLHARAADEPFFADQGPDWLNAKALESAVVPDPLPNETGHLLAAIDNATRALSLMRQREGDLINYLGRPVPGGFERVQTRLHLLRAMSFTRLGFDKLVENALQQTPRVLALDTYEKFFEDYGIRASLRPWMCYMVSHHLRKSDETTAFRFAILAIEGEERFGYSLSASGVIELEDWIRWGANSRFVCPHSETEYISGQKSSPISGIPHLEYVAVRRR